MIVRIFRFFAGVLGAAIFLLFLRIWFHFCWMANIEGRDGCEVLLVDGKHTESGGWIPWENGVSVAPGVRKITVGRGGAEETITFCFEEGRRYLVLPDGTGVVIR